jgi:predicted glycosyltransferase
MGRALRVVAYAVNGAGVGHLTRLTAIARWLRRYAAVLDRRLEIWFLTSSEADALLFHEGFASFKVPSKTSVAAAGIDKTAYLALAKQWIWHSLGLLRPDLFIVDSFPRGSFGELLPALDLCRFRAFIFRPMKTAFAERAEFQAMLPLYDRILVPETDAPVPVPEGVRSRVVHVGPVQIRERAELLPREEARRRLGVATDRLVVYISAGGGGDPTAVPQLDATVAALTKDPSLHLVVGAGPLFRGRAMAGERLTWLSGFGVSELTAGFDVAICAAGYNTFGELMQAGVPTIFLPQEKIADEQDARARRAVASGAACLPAPGPLAQTLPAALAPWRDPAVRATAGNAARNLIPGNGARTAAAELLRLLIPAAEVETAEALIGDDFLRVPIELGVPESLLFDLAHALGQPTGPGPGAGAHPSLPEARGLLTDPAAVGQGVVELVREVIHLGLPVEPAIRAGIFLVRRLPTATIRERRDGIRRLFEAAGPFADWAGTLAMLKTFGNERSDPESFVTELGLFLTDLHKKGEDLYRGISYLVEGSEPGNSGGSNVEMVRLARRRLA